MYLSHQASEQASQASAQDQQLSQSTIVGMSAEVVQKLQERATILTQERKKRGRTVPEELISAEQVKGFLTLASHPVCKTTSILTIKVQVMIDFFLRVYIQHQFLVFCHSIFIPLITARY